MKKLGFGSILIVIITIAIMGFIVCAGFFLYNNVEYATENGLSVKPEGKLIYTENVIPLLFSTTKYLGIIVLFWVVGFIIMSKLIYQIRKIQKEANKETTDARKRSRSNAERTKKAAELTKKTLPSSRGKAGR